MFEDTEDVRPDAALEAKFIATFVRGNFHGLREMTWDQLGRAIVISESQMVHLEEHAVDLVDTSDGEQMTRNRFEFESYDGPEPVGYRFPTEAEAAKDTAVAKALERGRRSAIAKARVDEEMAKFDAADFTPTPVRTRVGARQL